jgi:hypothetical protein
MAPELGQAHLLKSIATDNHSHCYWQSQSIPTDSHSQLLLTVRVNCYWQSQSNVQSKCNVFYTDKWNFILQLLVNGVLLWNNKLITQWVHIHIYTYTYIYIYIFLRKTRYVGTSQCPLLLIVDVDKGIVKCFWSDDKCCYTVVVVFWDEKICI